MIGCCFFQGTTKAVAWGSKRIKAGGSESHSEESFRNSRVHFGRARKMRNDSGENSLWQAVGISDF